EKVFRDLKNDQDFNRLKTKNSETTNGKIFLVFLALILRSHMKRLIKEDTVTIKYTLNNVIEELEDIRILNDGNNKSLVTLNAEQKNIIRVFDLSI
ncbi:hypothetical protein CKF54_06750, partial [Psittacicella hinzii]